MKKLIIILLSLFSISLHAQDGGLKTYKAYDSNMGDSMKVGTTWFTESDLLSGSTYTAGNGLSLSGTEFSINYAYDNSASLFTRQRYEQIIVEGDAVNAGAIFWYNITNTDGVQLSPFWTTTTNYGLDFKAYENGAAKNTIVRLHGEDETFALKSGQAVDNIVNADFTSTAADDELATTTAILATIQAAGGTYTAASNGGLSLSTSAFSLDYTNLVNDATIVSNNRLSFYNGANHAYISFTDFLTSLRTGNLYTGGDSYGIDEVNGEFRWDLGLTTNDPTPAAGDYLGYWVIADGSVKKITFTQRATSLAGDGLVVASDNIALDIDLATIAGAGLTVNGSSLDADQYREQALSGTAVGFNLDNGLNGRITLSGTTTITLSNTYNGAQGVITVTGHATTAYTVTIAGTNYWADGVAVGSVAANTRVKIAYHVSGGSIDLNYRTYETP